MMPFLRALSVSGSTINLSQFKEGMVSLVAPNIRLDNAKQLGWNRLLVIKENGGFSGRVTTMTSNSSGAIAVDSIGSIVPTDTFLPAPPGL
jgi:hypothetical protein